MNSAKETITVAIVGMMAACAPVVLVMVGIERSMNWMEERFGSEIAALAAFVFIGMIALTTGILLAVKVMKHTLNAFTDAQASTAEVYRANAGVSKEYARMQRDNNAIEGKYRLIEDKRVNQVADQKARLLMDLERQRWEAQAQARQPQTAAPVWAMDGGEGDDVRYYE